MIFIQLDEVLIDRVGHAAGVFGYEIPKGVAFGMTQLAQSLTLKRSEFYGLLDSANPPWTAAKPQPWVESTLRNLEQLRADYRLLGMCLYPHDVLKYFHWVETNLGTQGLIRLVLVTAAIDPPMSIGDTLVDVSEHNGRQWKRRNGRFLQWQPYTPGHPQHGTQWMRLLGQPQKQPCVPQPEPPR